MSKAITETERFRLALIALNDAAYAALKAGKIIMEDRSEERNKLKRMCMETDFLVDHFQDGVSVS